MDDRVYGVRNVVGDVMRAVRTEPHEETQFDYDQRARELSRQRNWDALLMAMGSRYRETTLKNFVVDTDEQRKVIAAIAEYYDNLAERVAAGVGVVLFGGVGGGKDHLLSALAKRAVALYLRVEWRNGAYLFAEMRDRIGDDRGEEPLVAAMVSPDVLVLSDPLPPVGSLSDFQSATLYRIIDRRYRDRKPTWCSLNIAGGEEGDRRMGAPIVDRLRDGALCLSCKWPSFRKPFAGGTSK
jgi:DNA replication protein DnaC